MTDQIELTEGLYAAKWGLSDFYPEAEARLREVLASGEDFYTSWGCKKEIRYANLHRDHGSLFLEVQAYMDDLYESDDLIYDALWQRCHTEEELPEDIIQSIRDAAVDCWLDDNTEACATLPADATFEDICSKLEALEDEAEKGNEGMFEELMDIVEDHVKFMKEERTHA